METIPARQLLVLAEAAQAEARATRARSVAARLEAQEVGHRTAQLREARERARAAWQSRGYSPLPWRAGSGEPTGKPE